MAEPFIGEIRIWGGNFAPVGWLFCDGSVLAISDYDVLYNLIGTTYGGDGQTTFRLPDLRGRLPVHQGTLSGVNYPLGQSSGTETVTLTTPQLPAHWHTFPANSASGNSGNPSGNVVSAVSASNFTSEPADTPMGGSMIGMTGGNQPHDNVMPFLCVTFIIATEGVYPSQN